MIQRNRKNPLGATSWDDYWVPRPSESTGPVKIIMENFKVVDPDAILSPSFRPSPVPPKPMSPREIRIENILTSWTLKPNFWPEFF